MDNILNSFPGYEFVLGEDNKMHNMYREVDLGFGGYVYAEPGIYLNVALLDVQSQHPHSILAMNCFGDYTPNFAEILQARIAIKHGDYDAAKKMMDGKLAKYLDNKDDASALAQALKIAINSVYGLTSAKFDNAFRDSRNKNNIVALRGALFMKTLQDEVAARGYTVAHIKTDSIKIPNATPEIIKFCMEFGEKYGYTFEHEATYDRMCLVNDAVYIAKYQGGKHDGEWTATGTQFQVPYVFKKLFSHEDITFDDLCETKTAATALYLDFNESLPDVSELENELADRNKHRSGKTNADAINSRPRSKSALHDLSDSDLAERIKSGHALHFVGKVGRFCPILPGHNGALLLRESKSSDGGVKYDAVGGTKGYRWLESTMVEEMEKQDFIDLSYYNSLVDEAIETISKYGDFEAFVAD